MTDILPVVLALALGLLAGSWAGGRVAVNRERRRRSAVRVNARLARLWPGEVPERSAADILAGVVHVWLGGKRYDLPVLPRAASRRWLELLDARFALVGDLIEAAGPDTSTVMALLTAETDSLYDLLVSYDESRVLPGRAAIDETTTDTEILRAVLEVWRAANPLVATLGAGASGPMPGPSGASPTTPPGPTAGTPAASRP